MAFTKLSERRGRRARTGTVSAISAAGGTGTSLFLSEDVAERLGFKAGDAVETQRGTDVDAGYLAVTKARKGSHLGKSGRQLRFYISSTAAGIAPPATVTVLPWRVDGNALVIDVRQIMPTAEVTSIKAA